MHGLHSPTSLLLDWFQRYVSIIRPRLLMIYTDYSFHIKPVELVNQSYRFNIVSNHSTVVINSLGGGHTRTPTHTDIRTKITKETMETQKRNRKPQVIILWS